MSHSCAVQAGNGRGLLGRQLAVPAHRQRQCCQIHHDQFEVPLANRGLQFMAAGATITCGQASNDDMVCWASRRRIRRAAALLRKASSRCAPRTPQPCHGRHRVQRRLSELLADLHRRPGRRALLRVLEGRGTLAATEPDPRSARRGRDLLDDAVDVGPSHVCAVTTRRDVWCFGDNSWGQFGTGVFTNMRTEKPVTAANR